MAAKDGYVNILLDFTWLAFEGAAMSSIDQTVSPEKSQNMAEVREAAGATDNLDKGTKTSIRGRDRF